MSSRAVTVLGLMFVAAFVLALALRKAATQTSELPSIENPGPRGLKALAVYLREGGRDVRSIEEPLANVPSDLRVVVLAAPTVRKIDREEVSAIRRWVEGGGTLVYLVPQRAASTQPALHAWLATRELPGLPAEPVVGAADPSGATAQVRRSSGVAEGLSALRVSQGFTLGLAEAEPIAGDEDRSTALRLQVGHGEVWLFAGPDVAENRRLELLDNLQLWENVAARGAIGFDELHHRPAPPPPVSVGLWAVVAQTLLCAVAYVLARGTRLGPPRPVLIERQRSIREYLEAFAALTRRARVEPDLLREQRDRLRRLMHEREGVPVTLSSAEAVQLLAERLTVDPDDVLRLLTRLEWAAASTPTPREFLSLTRDVTKLERKLTGRAR